jgi:Fic family protein
MYLHQRKDWPNFTWNEPEVLSLLSEVRYLQGLLLGKMRNLGFDLQNQAVLETITLDIVKSNEIEGENMDTAEVRSSVARKLGLQLSSEVHVGRYTEGVVEMMLDATQHYLKPLDQERLFGWHAALFPTGRSGMYKITVADWRKGEEPMQVVSGGIGREIVHFEAPHSKKVPEEMKIFLKWMQKDSKVDNIIKAAIAHLWFITIHPFDDGNGRITRAISDLFLAKSDNSEQRFYSMSASILENKKGYYKILESIQKDELDITEWVLWFIERLREAILSSEEKLKTVLDKAKFWIKFSKTTLNDRQKLMINKLLDGFTGKLRTGKWAKITKCSEKTALRDIEDLVEKDVLVKGKSGGRSTSYELTKI